MPQSNSDDDEAKHKDQAALEPTNVGHHTDEELQQELEDILPEDASEETREKVTRFLARHVSGPIPSGSEMEQYKHVDPDLPRQIFDMAKAEQDHRHEMEKVRQERSFSVYDETRKDKRASVTRGQWLGFAICLVVLGLAVLMAILGYAALAAIIATVDVVGLAAVFVNSTVSARKLARESDDKSDESD